MVEPVQLMIEGIGISYGMGPLGRFTGVNIDKKNCHNYGIIFGLEKVQKT